MKQPGSIDPILIGWRKGQEMISPSVQLADLDLRPVRQDEGAMVLTFLYLAARMPEAGEPIQKALSDDFLKKYWLGWGRSGDRGIVAIDPSTGLPISCAWVRQFSKEEAGSSFIADDIPELATGTIEAFRGKGIGTKTLKALIDSCRGTGRGVCLSVREENPAARLYESVGFRRISGSDTKNRVGTGSFNMLLEF